LSSRRVIWHDVRSAIGGHIWRGYGFFAYWDDQSLTAGSYARVGKAYGSAHNSLLEVVLGLGLIGLSAYVVLIANMTIGLARSLWARANVATVGWVIAAIFITIQNSMESFVLWHSYLWLLFVAAAVVPSRLFNPSSGTADTTSQPDMGRSLPLVPDEYATEPAMVHSSLSDLSS